MLTLKAATQDSHTRLEGLAIPVAGLAGMNLSDYAGLIAHNFQLHQALEPGLSACLDQQLPALNYGQERLKLPALEADLKALGQNLNSLHTIVPIEFTSLAQALGAAYVLEGATLGGQIIRRTLSARDDLHPDLPLNYYGLYGTEIGLRWRAFSQLVNEQLMGEAEIARASRSARETFDLASDIFAAEPFKLSILPSHNSGS